MKGLIYKEIVLTKKPLIMGLIYSLMAAVMLLLVRISMICGNLANSESLPSLQRNDYIFHYIPCIIFICALAGNSGDIYSDDKTGWSKFIRTTTVTPQQTVLSKMISKTLIISAAYVLSLIYIVLLCLFSGDSLTADMIGNITSIFFSAIAVTLFNVMFAFILKKKQIVDFIFSAVFGGFGMALTVSMLTKLDSMENAGDDFDPLDFFRTEYGGIGKYFLIIALLLAVISAVSCYFLSVKFIIGREE